MVIVTLKNVNSGLGEIINEYKVGRHTYIFYDSFWNKLYRTYSNLVISKCELGVVIFIGDTKITVDKITAQFE